MDKQIPQIHVGIVQSACIELSLEGKYRIENYTISGRWQAVIIEGKVELRGEGQSILMDQENILTPDNYRHCRFTLHDVTIGIGFHWERQEEQSFLGGLRFRDMGGSLMAINVLSLEDYLQSVISSEMSATSSPELLKAHAVISRSWLLAQIEKNKKIHRELSPYSSYSQTGEERIRWYDREDHEGFDVCADDHCQRYQGVTRMSTGIVGEAVQSTRGEVLAYDGDICDARFSKCCGGAVETFENVWEPVRHPYLQSFRDGEDGFLPDLKQEEQAEIWIRTTPEAYCNTNDKTVLSQVLNDYDQETNDFYRWTVEYTQEELSALVRKRSGVDFGRIVDLIPVARGESGRLIKLNIIGDKKQMVVGKELEIRKLLSASHLYSSAFLVEKQERAGKLFFILRGAGWGHGVGLCQIGAAVMGAKGCSYEQILRHYFRGARLEKRYG